MDIEKLKYPIGQFQKPDTIDKATLNKWIDDVETLPQRISSIVTPLTDEQLDTPYRPDGWTIRQVVHHVPDSHTNSYIRFKWALTEDKPTIKAYNEADWAELSDTKGAPVDLPLQYLSLLHQKLVRVMRSLSDEQLQRSFIHPETGNEVKLDENIGIYAWHGNHHYYHIKNLIEREGW